MIIDLKRVFDENGNHLDFKGSVNFSDEKYSGHTVFPENGKMFGKVFNDYGVIKLAYSVEIDFFGDCDYCLKNIHKPLSFEFSSQIVKEVSGEDDGSVMIVDDDMKLDMHHQALSDVFLALPMSMICEETCKGLCSVCGADLNTESCDCEVVDIDPRLAPLAKLLDKKFKK